MITILLYALAAGLVIAAVYVVGGLGLSIFRLIAKSVGATNRDADNLRQALLAQWAGHDGTYELVRRLRSVDSSDPDGSLGAEARLAIWFFFADPGDGRLVAEHDPVLGEISDEWRSRVAGLDRPLQA